MSKNSIFRYLFASVLFFRFAASLFAGSYPPEIAAWTQQQKQAQRAAGIQLIADITNAKNRGATTYTISAPNKHYRFSATTPQGNRRAFIKFLGMDHFTLDCNNATFWFEDDRLGIYIGRSTNFTLKRLNLDWDPLPFTQGTIESISTGNDSMRVRIEEGYERVTPGFAGMSPTSHTPNVRGAIVGTDGNFKSQQNLFRVMPFFSSPKNPDGSYTVFTLPFYDQPIHSLNAAVGDRVVFWIRGEGAVLIEGCHKVTLSAINLYSSSGLCFTDSSGSGQNTYRDCNIIRRPNTTRLFSGNCDGFHSVNTEYGPLIEDCDIDSIGDDAVNIHGVFSKVLAVESPRSIVVEQIAWRGDLGTLSYNFTKSGTFAPLGQRFASAKRAEYEGKPAHRLSLLSDLSEIRKDDLVTCTQFVGRDSIIRNNRFNNILTRGILFRSINGTIAKNTLSWIGLYGIAAMPQPESWGESTYNENLRITDNSLTDTFVFADADRRSQTRAGIFAYAPGHSEGNIQRHLSITGNVVTRPASHGIAIYGADVVSIQNNSLESYGELLPGNAIMLNGVTNLSLGGNFYQPGQLGLANLVETNVSYFSQPSPSESLPSLNIRGRKTKRTRRSSITVRGRATSGAEYIQWKTGSAGYNNASIHQGGQWNVTVRNLRRGSNKIRFRAVGGGKAGRTRQLVVIYH